MNKIKKTTFLLILFLSTFPLLGYRPSPDSNDYALYQAVEKGDLEQLKKLVKTKADANYIFPGGISLLTLACEKPNDPVLHYLVQLDADIHYCQYNQSVLDIACRNKIDWLVKKIVEEKPYKAEYVFFLACKNNNLEMVSFVLSKGVDINQVGKRSGRSAIYEAVSSDSLDVVKLLFKKGVKQRVNYREPLPLLFASLNQSNEMIQFLIENTKDLEEKVEINRKGKMSVLQYAFSEGNYRAALLLMEAGAEIDSIKVVYSRRARMNVPLFSAVVLESLDRSSYGDGEILLILESLLEQGEDINQEISTGRNGEQTALELAVLKGDIDFCKILLYHGANRDLVISDYGKELSLEEYILRRGADDRLVKLFEFNSLVNSHGKKLLDAITRGDKEAVETLLEKNADRGFRQDLDFESPVDVIKDASAFEFAIASGNIEIVKLFLNKNYSSRSNGNRPFIIAMKKDDLPMFLFLLTNSKKIESDGGYLLASSTSYNIKFAQVLLDSGLSSDAERYNNGRSLISSPISRNNVAMIKMFYQYSKLIDAQDKKLINALYDGDLIFVKKIIKQLKTGEDFDINRVYPGHLTALTMAASQGHIDIVQWLIESGADVNNRFSLDVYVLEQTPLYHSVRNGHIKTVKQLMKSGADIFSQNLNTSPLLLAAVESGNAEIVSLLLDAGVNSKVQHRYGGAYRDAMNGFQLAASNGEFEICKVFLEKSFPVDFTLSQDITPLMYAVISKDLRLVKYLVENGADVNRFSRNGNVLMFATIYSDLSIVRFLVKKGAKFEILDNLTKRKTYMLNKSLINSNFEIFNFLINNIELNFNPDEGGSGTILHQLFYKPDGNTLKKTKLLLKRKIDLNVRDRDGKTALFYAVERGDTETVGFLIKQGADINAPQINAKEKKFKRKNKRPNLCPLDYAQTFSMYKFLRDNGAKGTPGLKRR